MRSLLQTSIHSLFTYFKVINFFAIISLLSACGGGGSGDGGHISSSGGDEGSIEEQTGTVTPQIISDGYSGTVSTGVSYYQLTGYTPNTKYYVYLYEVSDDITLNTHASSYFLTDWCTSARAGTSSEGCDAFSDAGGSIYFSIDGSSTSAGASYKVAIYSNPVNEGLSDSHKDITTLLPYRGTVDHNGTSYYEVGGLVPGQNYTVSLTRVLFPVSLKTYPHRNLYTTSSVAPVCASDNADWTDETCVQAANFEGKIYIQVSDKDEGVWDFDGSFYTISVAQASGTGITFEGYGDAPVELATTELPYSSSTFSYWSYYKVTGLVPGQRYEVHFKNVEAGGADLNGAYINADDGTNTYGVSCTEYATSTSTSFSGWCVTTAGDSGNIFINAVGAYNNATSYQLDIVDAPVVEGSSTSPVALTTLPYDGQTDIRYTDSYYVISGLLPNWNYEVPYSNETRSIFLQTGTSTDTLLGGSTGKTNASGELYIRVQANSDDGAWFTLGNPVEANNPEGSIGSPLDISSATESSPHHGQVDDTSSYYAVTGLTPGKYYMVHMNGVEIGYGGVDLYSSSAFDFSSRLCLGSSFQTDGEGTCLAQANASGELYIQADAGWDITGSTYNIWTTESLISHEGQDGLPLDITGGINSGLTVTYPGQATIYKTSYYKLVLTSGPANYTVALSNMSGDVDLEVLNAITGWTDSCSSERNHLLNESCVIQSQAVEGGIKSVDLYIKVSVQSSYGDHWDGATFDLTVTPGGDLPVSEGTSVAPLDVTGMLPYEGKTNGTALNYYKITGLDPASQYEISTTNDIYGLATSVYSDAAMSIQLCQTRNYQTLRNETRRLACKTFPNASGELYLTVNNSNTLDYHSSYGFTLNVTAAPVAEGSFSVPVAITGTGIRASQVHGPLDGSGNYTASTVNSYYVVSGLTPGAEYIAHTRNNTEDVDLYIYSDAGFSVAECNTSFSVIQCAFTANAAGEAYIHADGYVAASVSGSFFDLHIDELPVAEGSVSTPIEITAGVTHNGQQGGYQNGSYYKVSGLMPYSTHRVMIRNQSADTPVYIYRQASMNYIACDIYGDLVQNGCSVSASAAGEIYIRTESNTNTDDATTLYELYVTP